jgi:Type II secretion system (T2SS), protein G
MRRAFHAPASHAVHREEPDHAAEGDKRDRFRRLRPVGQAAAASRSVRCEGLAALVRRTPGVAAWNGPYLKGGNVPNDPWSNAYVYRSPGDRGPYDILSHGADGQEGGSGLAADISIENMTGAKNE